MHLKVLFCVKLRHLCALLAVETLNYMGVICRPMTSLAYSISDVALHVFIHLFIAKNYYCSGALPTPALLKRNV